LAKFKKKKSEPTVDSNESKNEIVKEAPIDIPEKSEPVPDTPSGAVIAGTAATFIFEDIEGEDRRWASIGFMIIVFFGTVIVAKGMKMQLPSSDRKKIVTQAIGSYVFLYLFTWITTYTLVHSGNISNGINL